MEGSLISELQTQSPDQPNAEIPAAKKGKSLHKTVVKVKVKAVAGGGIGKQKNEGTPGDSWSWRKYGQKPIKGSPYPRGYYRCSTSKGCSAKKQVERCRTDASMLLVTYTSTHNHPGPTRNQPIQELAEEEEQNRDEISKGEQFNYFEPPQGVSPNPFTVDLDNTHESLGVLFDEEPIFYPPPIPIRTTPKPESDGSNDFFDELEELPIMSHLFSPRPASPTIGFS